MRRLLSILILVVLGLPFAAPVLAATANSDLSLPACCRKIGKHHCTGGMEIGATSESGPMFHAATEPCPYASLLPTANHRDIFVASPSLAIADVLLTHATLIGQSESSLRVARIRSRHKRGPPVIGQV